ncbi:hypothetical protein ACN4EG_20885 [Alkalinema pantanalense CENA528]|uniref:hypothetical protein n=1 Tax=Alkalinema pantanalense TaxID=1620705 RepID=UPI003D6F1813
MANKTRRNNELSIYWILIAICSVVPVIGQSFLLYATQDTTQFTVNKLERIANRFDEGAKYMVFTPNETFENTDVLLLGKLNSSDLYGTMQVGVTYEADVTGLRVPLLNWHRNIIRVREVSSSKQSP